MVSITLLALVIIVTVLFVVVLKAHVVERTLAHGLRIAIKSLGVGTAGWRSRELYLSLFAVGPNILKTMSYPPLCFNELYCEYLGLALRGWKLQVILRGVRLTMAASNTFVREANRRGVERGLREQLARDKQLKLSIVESILWGETVPERSKVAAFLLPMAMRLAVVAGRYAIRFVRVEVSDVYARLDTPPPEGGKGRFESAAATVGQVLVFGVVPSNIKARGVEPNNNDIVLRILGVDAWFLSKSSQAAVERRESVKEEESETQRSKNEITYRVLRQWGLEAGGRFFVPKPSQSGSSEMKALSMLSLTVQMRAPMIAFDIRAIQSLTAIIVRMLQNYNYCMCTQYRPTKPVRGNSRLWWNYAGEEVRKILRQSMRHKTSEVDMIIRRQTRLRYVNAYLEHHMYRSRRFWAAIPFLRSRLQHLEKDLSLEDIAYYRWWALARCLQGGIETINGVTPSSTTNSWLEYFGAMFGSKNTRAISRAMATELFEKDLSIIRVLTCDPSYILIDTPPPGNPDERVPETFVFLLSLKCPAIKVLVGLDAPQQAADEGENGQSECFSLMTVLNGISFSFHVGVDTGSIRMGIVSDSIHVMPGPEKLNSLVWPNQGDLILQCPVKHTLNGSEAIQSKDSKFIQLYIEISGGGLVQHVDNVAVTTFSMNGVIAPLDVYVNNGMSWSSIVRCTYAVFKYVDLFNTTVTLGIKDVVLNSLFHGGVPTLPTPWVPVPILDFRAQQVRALILSEGKSRKRALVIRVAGLGQSCSTKNSGIVIRSVDDKIDETWFNGEEKPVPKVPSAPVPKIFTRVLRRLTSIYFDSMESARSVEKKKRKASVPSPDETAKATEQTKSTPDRFALGILKTMEKRSTEPIQEIKGDRHVRVAGKSNKLYIHIRCDLAVFLVDNISGLEELEKKCSIRDTCQILRVRLVSLELCVEDPMLPTVPGPSEVKMRMATGAIRIDLSPATALCVFDLVLPLLNPMEGLLKEQQLSTGSDPEPDHSYKDASLFFMSIETPLIVISLFDSRSGDYSRDEISHFFREDGTFIKVAVAGIALGLAIEGITQNISIRASGISIEDLHESESGKPSANGNHGELPPKYIVAPLPGINIDDVQKVGVTRAKLRWWWALDVLIWRRTGRQSGFGKGNKPAPLTWVRSISPISRPIISLRLKIDERLVTLRLALRWLAVHLELFSMTRLVDVIYKFIPDDLAQYMEASNDLVETTPIPASSALQRPMREADELVLDLDVYAGIVKVFFSEKYRDFTSVALSGIELSVTQNIEDTTSIKGIVQDLSIADWISPVRHRFVIQPSEDSVQCSTFFGVVLDRFGGVAVTAGLTDPKITLLLRYIMDLTSYVTEFIAAFPSGTEACSDKNMDLKLSPASSAPPPLRLEISVSGMQVIIPRNSFMSSCMAVGLDHVHLDSSPARNEEIKQASGLRCDVLVIDIDVGGFSATAIAEDMSCSRFIDDTEVNLCVRVLDDEHSKTELSIMVPSINLHLGKSQFDIFMGMIQENFNEKQALGIDSSTRAASTFVPTTKFITDPTFDPRSINGFVYVVIEIAIPSINVTILGASVQKNSLSENHDEAMAAVSLMGFFCDVDLLDVNEGKEPQALDLLTKVDVAFDSCRVEDVRFDYIAKFKTPLASLHSNNPLKPQGLDIFVMVYRDGTTVLEIKVEAIDLNMPYLSLFSVNEGLDKYGLAGNARTHGVSGFVEKLLPIFEIKESEEWLHYKERNNITEEENEEPATWVYINLILHNLEILGQLAYSPDLSLRERIQSQKTNSESISIACDMLRIGAFLGGMGELIIIGDLAGFLVGLSHHQESGDLVDPILGEINANVEFRQQQKKCEFTSEGSQEFFLKICMMNDVEVCSRFSHLPWYRLLCFNIMAEFFGEESAPESAKGKEISEGSETKSGGDSAKLVGAWRLNIQRFASKGVHWKLVDDRPMFPSKPVVIVAGLKEIEARFLVEQGTKAKQFSMSGACQAFFHLEHLNSVFETSIRTVEDWPCRIELEIEQDAESQKDSKAIWIDSSRRLNIFYTHSLIKSALDVMAYAEMLQALVSEARVDVRHMSMESIGNSVSSSTYTLVNQSGLKLWYNSDIKRCLDAAYQVNHGEMDVLQVSPEIKDVTIKHNNCLVTRPSSQVISVWFEGSWTPCEIVVDRVGKQNHIVQSPTEDVQMNVVVDIELLARNKIIRIHSSLWLENVTRFPLGYKVYMPRLPRACHGEGGYPTTSVAWIMPGKGVYLPLHAMIGGLLYFRFKFTSWSDRDVVHLSGRGEQLRFQQGFIGMRKIGKFLGTSHATHNTAVCLEIAQSREAEESGVPEYILNVRPPLVIRNAVPYGISVSIFSYISTETNRPITAGNREGFYDVQLDRDIRVTLAFEDSFRSLNAALVHAPRKVHNPKVVSSSKMAKPWLLDKLELKNIDHLAKSINLHYVPPGMSLPKLLFQTRLQLLEKRRKKFVRADPFTMDSVTTMVKEQIELDKSDSTRGRPAATIADCQSVPERWRYLVLRIQSRRHAAILWQRASILVLQDLERKREGHKSDRIARRATGMPDSSLRTHSTHSMPFTGSQRDESTLAVFDLRSASHRVELSIHNRMFGNSGAREVTFYSPYLLVNRTRLVIYLKQAHNRNVITLMPRTIADDELPFDSQDQAFLPVLYVRDAASQLRVDDRGHIQDSLYDTMSEWSDKMNFGGIGIKNSVSVCSKRSQREGNGKAAQYDIAIEIIKAPNPFNHSLMVIFRDLHILENLSGLPLEFKQRGADAISTIQPGERTAFHWQDSELEFVLVVRPVSEEAEWYWSGGFSVNEENQLGLRIMHTYEEDSQLILPCEITAVRGLLLTTFFEPGRVAQYRIENHLSDHELKFNQIYKTQLSDLEGSEVTQHSSANINDDAKREAVMLTVPPRCSLDYAWDEPLEPHLIELFLGDQSRKYNLDEVGKVLAPFVIGDNKKLARSVTESSNLKSKFKKLLTSEGQRRFYVSIFADGPTRVFKISEEKNAATLGSDKTLQGTLQHLLNLRQQLHEVYRSFPGTENIMRDLLKTSASDLSMLSDLKGNLMDSKMSLRALSMTMLSDRSQTAIESFMNFTLVDDEEQMDKNSELYASLKEHAQSHRHKSAENLIPLLPTIQKKLGGASTSGKQEDTLLEDKVSRYDIANPNRLAEMLGGRLDIRVGEACDLPMTRKTQVEQEVLELRVHCGDEERKLFEVRQGLAGSPVHFGFSSVEFKGVAALSTLTIEAFALSRGWSGKREIFLGEIIVPLLSTVDHNTGEVKTFKFSRKSFFGPIPVSGTLEVSFVWDISIHELMKMKVKLLEDEIRVRSEILSLLRDTERLTAKGEGSAKGKLSCIDSGPIESIGTATDPQNNSNNERNDKVVGGKRTVVSMDKFSGTLELKMLELRNLPFRTGGVRHKLSEFLETDYSQGSTHKTYVKVKVAAPGVQRERRSRVVDTTTRTDVKIDERFNFTGIPGNARIHLYLYDSYLLIPDKLLGEVSLTLSKYADGDAHYELVDLKKRKKKSKDAAARLEEEENDPRTPDIQLRILWRRDLGMDTGIDQSTFVDFGLVSVGATIVDYNPWLGPRELSYLLIERIAANLQITEKNFHSTFSVASVQLDNQLENANNPVILAPTALRVKNTVKPSDEFLERLAVEELGLINVSFSMENESEGMSFVKNFVCFIGELDISVEEYWVDTIIQFISSATMFTRDDLSSVSRDAWKEYVMENTQHTRQSLLQGSDPPYDSMKDEESLLGEIYSLVLYIREDEEKAVMKVQDSSSGWYYLEYVEISSMVLNVTLTLGNPPRGSATVDPIISTYTSAYGFKLVDLDNISMSIYGMKFENGLFSKTYLTRYVTRHLIWEVLRNAHKILSSVPLLGIPVEAAANLTAAAARVVRSNENRNAENEISFKCKNVAMDVSANFLRLLQALTVAGMKISYRFCGLGGECCAVISLDPDFVTLIQRRPTSISEAFTMGAKEFGLGIGQGCAGTCLLPYQGSLDEDNPRQRCLIGAGKGAVGALTKPTAGCLQFMSRSCFAAQRSVESINNERTRRSHILGFRVRNTLRFSNTEVVGEVGLALDINEELSYWAEALKEIKGGRFRLDKLLAVGHVTTAMALLFTDKRLLKVFHVGEVKDKIKWSIRLEDIEQVTFVPEQLKVLIKVSRVTMSRVGKVLFCGMESLPDFPHKLIMDTRDHYGEITWKLHLFVPHALDEYSIPPDIHSSIPVAATDEVEVSEEPRVATPRYLEDKDVSIIMNK